MKQLISNRNKSIPSLQYLPPISNENFSNPVSTKASTFTDKQIMIFKNKINSARSSSSLDQNAKISNDAKVKSLFRNNIDSVQLKAKIKSMVSTKETFRNIPQKVNSLQQVNPDKQDQVKSSRISRNFLNNFISPQSLEKHMKSRGPIKIMPQMQLQQQPQQGTEIQVEQNEQPQQQEQQNALKKLLKSFNSSSNFDKKKECVKKHSYSYFEKKEKFHIEVRELQQKIEEYSSKQIRPKKRSIIQSPRNDSNMFHFFQPLIQFSVLDEDYNQNKGFQGISPIILKEYRSSEFQKLHLNKNGTGLILAEYFGVCTIIPCLNFQIEEKNCYKHPADTDLLIQIMKELIIYQFQVVDLIDQEINAIIKEIIFKHCQFSLKYKQEKIDYLQSYKDWVIFKKPLYQLKDNGRNFSDIVLTVQLGHQQIESPEIIFNPSGKYRHIPKIMDLIKQSLKGYLQIEQKQILSNIVCVGEYFHLKGFEQRIKQELQNCYKNMDIQPAVKIMHSTPL